MPQHTWHLWDMDRALQGPSFSLSHCVCVCMFVCLKSWWNSCETYSSSLALLLCRHILVEVNWYWEPIKKTCFSAHSFENRKWQEMTGKKQSAKKQQFCPVCVRVCVETSFRDHDEISLRQRGEEGLNGYFTIKESPGWNCLRRIEPCCFPQTPL